MTRVSRPGPWCLLCSSLAALTWAQPTPAEPLARSSSSVVLGEPTDGSHAMVARLLIRSASGSEGYCSATLIAPDLLLTARHCIGLVPETYLFRCLPGDDLNESTVVVGEYPVDALRVFFGDGDTTDPAFSYPVAQIYSPDRPSYCGADIALVRLATPVVGFPVTPINLAPPLAGSPIEVVGWGYSSESSPLLGSLNVRRDIKVRRIGPDSDVLAQASAAVLPGEVSVDSSACFGDSGGPFFAQGSRAAWGLLSRVVSTVPVENPTPYCEQGRPIYTRLDAHRAFIEQVFASRGLVPWVEGQPTPAFFGESCSETQGCWSGLCLTLSEGGQCTQRCSASDGASCPGGFACGQADGKDVCVPVGRDVLGPGGCALSPTSTSPLLPALFGLAVLVSTLRLIRRPVRSPPMPRGR